MSAEAEDALYGRLADVKIDDGEKQEGEADSAAPPLLHPCQRCSLLTLTKCSSCKQVFYCSRPCQKRDWKTHKAVCGTGADSARFEEVVDTSKMTLKVSLARSRRHGRGVFALEDLKKGEKVCFYDGDQMDAAVRVRMARDPKQGTLTIKNAREVFQSLVDSRANLDRCLAHHDPRKNQVLVGYEEPRSDFGLAQFVNDAARPLLKGLDFAAGVTALQAYQAESESQSNVEVGPANWFQTTRPVRKGEELLAQYGFEFWLRKYMLESQDSRERFHLYSLHDQSSKPFDLRNFYNYDEDTCRAFMEVLIGVPPEEMKGRTAKDVIYEYTEMLHKDSASVAGSS